jgi:hypothetical protein
MNKTKILIVKFKNPLKHSEVPFFRGAVNNVMTDTNPLFNNHSGDSFIYTYPKIQYKRIKGNAAIVCVNEGAEIIGNFFNEMPPSLQIGNKQELFEIESINAYLHLIQIWDSLFEYNLSKWMPFNQDNYNKYSLLESITEKSKFLEDTLFGNFLSMTKGIGIQLSKSDIIAKITYVNDPIILKFKGVNMMTFNIIFKTNLYIPDYMGIGKGVSMGYGIVTHKYDSNNENK